jgi:predicted alpha/beta superfamily hydrolase
MSTPFNAPQRQRIKTTFFRALLLATVCCIATASSAQGNDSIYIAHTKSIESKILGEKRTLYISTPSRMKPGETFPVMYLLDGEAFIELAGGQMRYLSESYKINPSMIIVGIANTDRFRDLTPTHLATGPDGKPDTSAASPTRNSGGGEKFLQFIKQELMPYVETNYPAAPYKILAGHSLGGLMAAYCLIQHPDYFNAYVAASPSFQWDSEAVLKMAEKMEEKTSGKMLFFCDANEGAAFHANQLRFDSLLKKKNITGLKYKYAYYPEESHTSEPVKAFYDGMRFIYPEWYLTYNSAFRQKVTAAIIREHYEKLSGTYGYRIVPLQEEIVQVSRFLRNDPKRINDAIDLLNTYLPSYPKAANMHELLGDIYLKSGDSAKAVASYQKALSIDANNEALKQKMGKIK